MKKFCKKILKFVCQKSMELLIDADIFLDEEEEKRKKKRKERRKERENSKIPDSYVPNQRELNWFLVIKKII